MQDDLDCVAGSRELEEAPQTGPDELTAPEFGRRNRTMETKNINSKIDDSASKTKDLVAKVAKKSDEVARDASLAAASAGEKVKTMAQKGEHQLHETAEKVSHAVTEIASKVVHAAQETAEKVVNGAKELAHKAQHRGEEVAGKPVDKRREP